MRRALSPIPLAVLAHARGARGAARVRARAERARRLASRTPPPAASARRRPHFELPRLEGGGEGSLADYRGQVVVLNFWASWCEPCRTESPLLERWHRRISQGGRGTVLGIDGQDVSSDAREFVRDFELVLPHAARRPGRPARAVRRARLSRDLRDRRPRPRGGRAARAGERGVHARPRWRRCSRRAREARGGGAGRHARAAGAWRRPRSPPTAPRPRSATWRTR